MFNESSLKFLRSINKITFLLCVSFVLKEKIKKKDECYMNTTFFVKIDRIIYQILANIEHH